MVHVLPAIELLARWVPEIHAGMTWRCGRARSCGIRPGPSLLGRGVARIAPRISRANVDEGSYATKPYCCRTTVVFPPTPHGKSSLVLTKYFNQGKQKMRQSLVCALPLLATLVVGTGARASTDQLLTYRVANVQWNDVLNIRGAPSLQSRVVGVIPPDGSDIALLGAREGQWVLIRYRNAVGWVNQRYVTAVAGWCGRSERQPCHQTPQQPPKPQSPPARLAPKNWRGDA